MTEFRTEFRYKSLLLTAAAGGTVVSPRGLATRQLPPIQFEMPMGDVQCRTGFNTHLAVVEGLNLMRGWTDLELLRSIAPKTTRDFYDPNDMSYYGERVYVPRLIRLLKLDPSTRKAYCSMVMNEDADRSTRCISLIQFQQLHSGVLDMHVHLRSWDLFRGLPYDVGMTQFLAVYLAEALGVKRGTAYFTSSLPHVYETQLDKIASCVPWIWPLPDFELESGRPWDHYCNHLLELFLEDSLDAHRSRGS